MEELDRLREQREQVERQNAAATRHRLVAGYFVAGLAVIA